MTHCQIKEKISTHSPRVGRTVMDRNTVSHFSDFNSLAPCGANRWYFWTSLTFTLISTHSPRVGRTGAYSLTSDSDSNFNSLAPCGANHILLIIRRNTNKFQLTRPVWGEPNGLLCSFRHTSISTHSPRVGRTRLSRGMGRVSLYFNSLAPCGANPEEQLHNNQRKQISTHSPRVGRTKEVPMTVQTIVHFNSLAPCGANPDCTSMSTTRDKFQLTRPVWGEPI